MTQSNAGDAVKNSLQTLCDLYKQELLDKDAVASTALLMSVEPYIDEQPLSVGIQAQHYWKYVEGGRSAGAKMPPVAAIRKWIDDKGIIPRAFEPNKRPPTKDGLAFIIARAIGRDGIEPRPLLQTAFDKEKGNLLNAVALYKMQKIYILLKDMLKQ